MKMYNIYGENGRWRKIMKRTFVLLLVGVAIFGGAQFLGSLNSSATEADDELLTLFCSNAEASQAVVTSYEEDNVDAALRTADELVRSGDCSYQVSIRYWNPGRAPDEYKQFEKIQCTESTSGLCIANQPAFTEDEDGLNPGFMLVSQNQLPDQRLEKLMPYLR